jgi:hypothetical protein
MSALPSEADIRAGPQHVSFANTGSRNLFNHAHKHDLDATL